MKLADFASYFRNDDEEVIAAETEESRLVLNWMSQEYYRRFLKWLDSEASKPIEVSADHMQMVKNAVRANTLREVKKHLERLEERANAAIRLAREEQ